MPGRIDGLEDLLDVPDGTQVETELWPNYRDATLRFWNRFPEFSIAGNAIVLTEPVLPRAYLFANHLWRSFRKIVSFVRSSKQFPALNIKCDVVLQYHGDKPSVRPPVEHVARSLAKHDRTALVLSGEKRAEVWRQRDGQPEHLDIEEIPDYASSVHNGGGIANSLYLVTRSLLITVVLLVILAIHRKTLKLAFSNPFAVWIHILISSRRLQIAQRILDETEPEILLTTNERTPMAASFLASRNSKATHRILLFSELFTEGLHPIFSDEVLVWNRTVEHTLRRQDPNLVNIPFSIVGSPELNIALTNRPPPNSSSTELLRTIGNRPILLFLVDYDRSKVRNSEVLAAESHQWIGATARRLPEWFFILKTRPNHHDIELPGLSETTDIENLKISRGDIELNEFLLWENLQVVAGYSSTGLFVAAGFGKDVYRFIVSKQQGDVPLIDDISTRIHSTDQLVEHLAKTKEAIPVARILANGASVEDEHFPYKETTLDRILEVILEDLNTPVEENTHTHESIVEHD